MADSLFIKGLILGFSVAAPVGPIGVLCIQRSLSYGQLYGLASGLGAATADALYGFIAAFGLTLITDFFTAQITPLRLGGGLFLCYLGIKTLYKTSTGDNVQVESRSLFSAYLSTFVLTVTNPMTILFFTLVFAGLGLSEVGDDYAYAGLVVFSVFLGSAMWWLLLSGGVGIFRDRFKPNWLKWINRLAGLIIAGFGVNILLSLWR